MTMLKTRKNTQAEGLEDSDLSADRKGFFKPGTPTFFRTHTKAAAFAVAVIMAIIGVAAAAEISEPSDATDYT